MEKGVELTEIGEVEERGRYTPFVDDTGKKNLWSALLLSSFGGEKE